MHLACENFSVRCASRIGSTFILRNISIFIIIFSFFFFFFIFVFRFCWSVVSLSSFNCWTSCSGGVYVSLVRVFVRYKCMHISFISDMRLTIVTPVSAVAFAETNQHTDWTEFQWRKKNTHNNSQLVNEHNCEEISFFSAKTATTTTAVN